LAAEGIIQDVFPRNAMTLRLCLDNVLLCQLPAQAVKLSLHQNVKLALPGYIKALIELAQVS